MSYQVKSVNIGNGIRYSSITDKKFKHNRISICMVMPLERESVTVNALVPYVLKQGTKNCPSFVELNKKLAELYGASLDAAVDKYGKYQLLSLAITSIDDRYALNGEKLIEECAKLLCEAVLEPNIADGEFKGDVVELEKQFLIDTIRAEINDKRVYAAGRCRSIMCEGEPVAIKKYGYEEDAKAITNKTAAQAYENIISNSKIEFMFVGSGDPTSGEKVVREFFGGLNRTDVTEIEPIEYKPNVEKARTVTETMNIAQAKLVMGMRVGIPENDREMAALRLMSSLYGGTPVSLLFKNVREKLSLCYYCASRFNRTTGILTVESGIEDVNKDKAVAEILAQLQAIKEGRFTQEELDHCKMILSTASKAATDSLSALENWYLTQLMRGTQISPDEDFALLSSITAEEIAKMANTVQLDTTYLLTGAAQA